ncbi:MAG: DUF58 domain-containing protein [Candidatus Omnitrophica bacterium]|nr:DUF58 domain-containing protein [Candidatus Omnitrophota bacterium]
MRFQFLYNKQRSFALTESGVYTFAAAFLLTLLGFVIQSNLIYLVVSGLWALLLSDLFLSVLALKGIKAGRLSPTYSMRDEDFKVRIRIENNGLPKFLVRITDSSFTENIPGVSLPVIPKLNKGEVVNIDYAMKIKARGVYNLSYVKIESCFPLGLWKRIVNYPSASRITIYPEYYEVPQFAVSFRGIRSEFANTSSNRPGTGGNFLQIRDYQYGDSLKNIHWRATARTGHLMVKELEKFTLSNLSVILDSSASLVLGLQEESNFEYAIKTVATIANKALSTRYHVKFIYYDQIKRKIQFTKAYGRMTPILNSLSKIDTTDVIKVKDLIDASVPEIERESIAVFVLLSLTSDVTQRIISLANQGIESVIIIFDPRSFAAVLDQKIGNFYGVFSQLMSTEASYLTGEGIRVYLIKQGDHIPEALSRPHMFVAS